MLLKHRPPGIDSAPAAPRAGFEHIEAKATAVLRWLNANKVDYVLVGPVARAIRGEATARGPVAIVPAPYRRNYERLTRALVAQHAGLRSERGIPGSSERADTVPVKLTAEKLARGRRWLFRCDGYDLDVERAAAPAGRAGPDGSDASDSGASGVRYQELIYESNRFEPAEGVAVEVAAPEDLEHFSHVRRTGSAPEFRLTRNAAERPSTDDAQPSPPPADADQASAPADGSSAGETG